MASDKAAVPEETAGTPDPRVRHRAPDSPVRRRDRLPLTAVLTGCAVLLVVVMTLGVAIGSVPLSPVAVWQVIIDHILGHPQTDTVADEIV